MTIIDRITSVFRKKSNEIITPETKISALDWLYGGLGGMFSWGFDGSKSQNALQATMSRYQVVIKNTWQLRAQARKSWIESTETRAIVGRSVELTISTGLKLEWTPVFEICLPRLVREENRELQKTLIRDVEQRFRLFAESTESDITGRRTFYQLQYFARHLRKIDGEYFAHIRYLDKERSRMSPIAIQFFRPEQVRNPTKNEDIKAIQDRKNICVEGIEIDQFGKAVAYYVHSGETYVRIEKQDEKTGRIYMLHGANIDEVGQIRGTSSIASYLHELSKLTGYKIAELQAAVVNALVAGWIEPSEDADSSKPFSNVIKKNQIENPNVTQAPKQAETYDSGLWIQNLKAGEKFHSHNTARPNVNFAGYFEAMFSTMCSAEGYAGSVVSVKFNSNYSAHRGELLLTWNKVEIEREEENTSFNNPFFRMFLMELNRQNPGYLENFGVSGYITNAWCKADWVGFPKLDIDPSKTVQAAAARVKEGFSTRSRESLQINGSEFDDNVKKLEEENEKLYEANKYLQETSVRGNTKPAPIDREDSPPNNGSNEPDDE